jgi:hypothetical protein
MKAFKRFVVGLLLLPVCYGLTLGAWEVLHPFRNVPEMSVYLLAGLASYFAFQWVFFRPLRTYVFGHELTHALAAWLSGGDVRHFHVGKKGGSVTVSKSNIFVALAPYFIPLYATILLLGYYGVIYFYPELKAYFQLFLWVLGASLGFHMALTAYALKQDQPDLKTVGKFLSAVVIYVGNTLSIVLMLGILFPKTVSWERFARVSARETVTAIQHVGRGSRVIWSEIFHESQSRD